jgi:hypothetical protein
MNIINNTIITKIFVSVNLIIPGVSSFSFSLFLSFFLSFLPSFYDLFNVHLLNIYLAPNMFQALI